MTKTEFFKLLEKSGIAQAEQNRLFHSMRKSIVLFYLGRRQYERDRFQEDNFQREIFEKILKSEAKEFKKLIFRLKLDEIDLKLDAAKKKLPAHILARFTLEQKIVRFEEFLKLDQWDKKHFQKIASRYNRMRNHFEKKTNGKSWKIGLGVGAAVLLGAGAVALYKKVTEKKKEEK